MTLGVCKVKEKLSIIGSMGSVVRASGRVTQTLAIAKTQLQRSHTAGSWPAGQVVGLKHKHPTVMASADIGSAEGVQSCESESTLRAL